MAAMGEGGGNAVIDRAKFGPLQFGVTALCFIIAMLDGFDTQSIAFVAPKIAEDWGLAPSAFGPIFAIGHGCADKPANKRVRRRRRYAEIPGDAVPGYGAD